MSAQPAAELEQVSVAIMEGRNDAARSVLLDGVARARAAGAGMEEAELLSRLAQLEVRIGEYSEGDAHAVQAARLYADAGHAPGQVAALTTAVLACTHLRRYDDAYAAAYAANDVALPNSAAELRLMAMRALAAAHAAAGAYEDSLQLFARMIDVAREAGLWTRERRSRADWLVINLSWLTDPAALHASAPDREHLTMLQAWAEQLMHQPAAGTAEDNLRERTQLKAVLAQIHVALGNAAQARVAIDDAARDSTQLQWSNGVAESPVVEAEVYLLEGEPLRGVDSARRAIELAKRYDLMVVEGKACDVLARCAEAAGDNESAVRALRRHMQVTREILRLRSENRVRIERWRESMKQREQLDTLSAQATSFRELSLQDPLTGLANRRGLDPLVTDALAHLRTHVRPCALAVLDIDDFKSINDRHSHVIGDAVLKTLADVLRETLRGSDIAARTGGDEFVVLFPDASPADASAACERILAVIHEHDWNDLSPGLVVGVSIGVTGALPDDTVESLMRRADLLMYERKSG